MKRSVSPRELDPASHREDGGAAVAPTMVLVRLPKCSIPLSYYNDRFALNVGDIVFVEGKYAGVPGRVEKVSTSFRVDLEEYKRVVGVADTAVRGTFCQAGSHLVTFEPGALPYRQALSWHKALEERHYIQYDEEGFALKELDAWPFGHDDLHRGVEYFGQNRVVYLCVESGRGKAIVRGTRAYELRFRYHDGRVSAMSCGCPRGVACKHEAAALLQLKETLEHIEEKYQKEYERSGYFAAVSKESFYSLAVDGNEDAVLRLC